VRVTTDSATGQPASSGLGPQASLPGAGRSRSALSASMAPESSAVGRVSTARTAATATAYKLGRFVGLGHSGGIYFVAQSEALGRPG
jgi:hypothetical protein